MKIEQEFKVGIKDIGIKNKLTNYALLSFLEEIGCYHSDLAGFGINDIERTKKAWILMNWKLKVIDRIKYGDKLQIKTWTRPMEKNKYYTYREFEVYNESKKIAMASSRWVLFDIDLKKIVKISENILSNYYPESNKVFENEIENIKNIEDFTIKKQYEVQRADIDINKHMHNLNYLKIAYEVLPEKLFWDSEKNNVNIMYKHQILYGEKINCYYICNNNRHTITLKSKDDKILHAIIELY